MSKFRRLAITLAVMVGLFTFVFAGTALAGTNTATLNYCGPAFTSKAAMISWLQQHPYQASKAEAYVRKHAGYYHPRADQSFIAWLSMPNIKFKLAPAGYSIFSNTGCDAASNVVPYDGLYGVSRLPMLWWCNDPSGSGSNCTPIAKYYCRNWVMGKMVFISMPMPTPAKPYKPKPLPKPKPAPAPAKPFVWVTKNWTPRNCSTTVSLREYDGNRVVQLGTAYPCRWTKYYYKHVGDNLAEVVRVPAKAITAVSVKITGPGQHITFNNKTTSTPPPATTPAPMSCTLNGVTGVIVNGICVVNSTSTTQTCGPNEISVNNVCVNNSNVNNNTNTNTVTVVVTPATITCTAPDTLVNGVCTAPTPTHFTNLTCTGFEEISGGGSFLVTCSVSNDNGAQIGLSIQGESNVTTSGINCSSQGGSPACNGNGTFQFRVVGVNNGSTTLTGSVTAVATSNGVNSTPYNSGSFNVDPSGGGF
jgi:hypothetical protein